MTGSECSRHPRGPGGGSGWGAGRAESCHLPAERGPGTARLLRAPAPSRTAPCPGSAAPTPSPRLRDSFPFSTSPGGTAGFRKLILPRHGTAPHPSGASPAAPGMERHGKGAAAPRVSLHHPSAPRRLRSLPRSAGSSPERMEIPWVSSGRTLLWERGVWGIFGCLTLPCVKFCL